jgi:isopentenyl diphosphate isomerase/L-lactate dehydrogenase-like FMN-dependent dehydrogenase
MIPPNIGNFRQFAIYTGAEPSVPVSVAALEQKAREMLPPPAFDYVAGGAGGERTMRANLDAFDRYPIVPRMLRDVSTRDLSVSLFGTRMPAPILLAPVGVQSIIHPEGELPAARAAAALGVPFIVSTVSSRRMEEIAAAMGEAPRWFQLYPSSNSEINGSFLDRAEAAGYSAIVATLDTRMMGWRERDLTHAFLPFLQAQGLANYFTDPVFRAAVTAPPEADPTGAIRYWSTIFSHPGSTWEDLRTLRHQTRLPLLLKGIVHPDDARLALDYGIDGIVVSNHGGRQVDGAMAALDALPGVVQALAGRIPVLFDSGIRRGADVVKALSLGARAVLIGRLYCWGLAVAGEEGVRDAVLNLIAETDLTFALSGFADCAQVKAAAGD